MSCWLSVKERDVLPVYHALLSQKYVPIQGFSTISTCSKNKGMITGIYPGQESAGYEEYQDDNLEIQFPHNLQITPFCLNQYWQQWEAVLPE